MAVAYTCKNMFLLKCNGRGSYSGGLRNYGSLQKRNPLKPAAPFQASRSVSRVQRVSYHSNHRTGAHVFDQQREEWFVLQVNVVFHQQVFAGLQQETGDRGQFDKGFVQVPQKLRARISDATDENPNYTAFMQLIITPTFMVNLQHVA